jgi:hypothetical protein
VGELKGPEIDRVSKIGDDGADGDDDVGKDVADMIGIADEVP